MQTDHLAEPQTEKQPKANRLIDEKAVRHGPRVPLQSAHRCEEARCGGASVQV